MSVKTEVIDILNQSKVQFGAVIDSIIPQINALSEDPDLVTLQQQITDLQTQLQSAKDSLSADDAALAAEKDKEAALQTTIDNVKKILGLI